MHTKHGEAVVIEYWKTGRRWHPHSIQTVTGTSQNGAPYGDEWDAAWSKSFGGVLLHRSGAGPRPETVALHGFVRPAPPPARLWLASGIKPVRYLKRARVEDLKTSGPLTNAQLRRMGYVRIAEPLGDPFEDAQEVDSSPVYCSVCDDWYDEADNRPCGHLRWSDTCCSMVGIGADSDYHEAIRKSLGALSGQLGDEGARQLHAVIARGRDWYDYDVDGLPDRRHERTDEEEPAFCWLDTLGTGRGTGKARKLTLGWLKAG